MDMILADIYHDTQTPYPVIFARLAAAILFGGIIGWEREKHARPAGFRTHILVCMAAAMFAIISIESVHMAGFSDEQVRIDPLRVIEAVTAGVAFLAAGTIVYSRGQVNGLTTGAGMWMAGGIGLALGFGHWFIAAFATISCLTILLILAWMQRALIDEETREKKKDVSHPDER